MDELEKFILDNGLKVRRPIFDAARERCNKLNRNFVMDDSFIDQFVIINDKLTQLMNELFDKMNTIKKTFSNLIQTEKSSFNDFYLEGFIDYEDKDKDFVDMPEFLTNMELSGQWFLHFSSEENYSETDKKEMLLSHLNWDIEIFDMPEIKARNIWVSYMMHSLFCDGYLSLQDMMTMKPEYFYLSIKASID